MVDIDALFRLAAAAVLSGALGWERQLADKPAGFRTHMIVGVTAALYALLGQSASVVGASGEIIRTDPVRTIQAVATGIGFLGAGIIFRDGNKVTGLTTAASVWAAASIGIAAAWGEWALALMGTAVTLFALRVPVRAKTRAVAGFRAGVPGDDEDDGR